MLPAQDFLSDSLGLKIADWISGRRGPEHGDVLLDRKRVYILPTRAGLIFAAAMLVLLIGSINYSLQMGFLLTFLVISMALVGMYHTHRNLARLSVRAHHADNTFAGDHVSFELVLVNPTEEARYALGLSFMLPRRRKKGLLFSRENETPVIHIDVPARSDRYISLTMPTRRRGARPCPRVRIDTRFPFGLWNAWAYYAPPLQAMVYPVPEQNAPPLPLATEGELAGVGTASSGEDFAGVRPYQSGDPQKTIAWKLVARSDQLAVKLFEATAGGELLLDFGALPAQMAVEDKLSRLTRWVLEADAANLRYALRVPGTHVPLGRGVEQRERCLTALALAPSEP